MAVTEGPPANHSLEEGGLLQTVLPTKLRWAQNAPVAIKRASSKDDPSTLAVVWRQHLLQRDKPRPLSQRLDYDVYQWGLHEPAGFGAWVRRRPSPSKRPGSNGPVASTPSPASNGRDPELLLRADGSGGQGRSAASPSPLTVLGLLHQCDALLAGRFAVSDEELPQWIARLVSAATESAGFSASGQASKSMALPEEDDGPHYLWRKVLWHGELPWTVACLFPEVAIGRKLASSARRVLAKALVRLCDTDGMPYAKHFSLLLPLVASLTRCLSLASQMGRPVWTPAIATRWNDLVLQCLRLVKPDGSLALAAVVGAVDHSQMAGRSADSKGRSNGRAAARGPAHAPLPLLREMVETTGDIRGRALLKAIGLAPAKRVRSAPAKLPEASCESERAQVAILRTGWKQNDNMLVARHDRSPLAFELTLNGKPVLDGPWQIALQVDGRPLERPEDCQVVCWSADEDVVYLELRLDWPGGVMLERQLLVARREPLVLLADSVKARRRCSLAYTGQLTLAAGLAGSMDRRSRLGAALHHNQRRCSVIPLGLDQWRVQKSGGSLEMREQQIQLTAVSPGKRLYAPLLIHGFARRATDAQWRSLTVTSDRRIVGSDEAVGYRVRLGAKRQLFLYRSLGPCSTRAVLGHQTNSEFVLGWFDHDGDVDPLVQVT